MMTGMENERHQWIERALGAEPHGLAMAHGRVNLIGEHIDYHGGTVLPTAIPNRADVGVVLGTGLDHDTVYADGFGQSVSRPLDDPANHHWSDYVVGALQLARAEGLIEGGARLATVSDVPHGAGLSSSAAITVATLKAILTAAGRMVDNVQVSLWAQSVEHHYIGMPCGIMDQMAVAIATHGQALCLDTDSLAYTLVDLPADHRFMVVHSGVTRRLEDGRYAGRRHESEAAAQALGVPQLCKMSDEAAARVGTLDPVLQRRARHVHSEHRRVLDTVTALNARDFAAVGALFAQSHRSMRDDFEMTTPQIDALVEGAVETGAVGARLTGGGFGGCIVALVPAAAATDWYSALERRFPAISLVA